jgi:hypothetical protein
MKSGMIGALVGLFVGAMIGTALFGPIGGVVGIAVGTLLGFLILTPLVVWFAQETAKTPFVVTCPETRADTKVTLDPKEAGRAALWNKKQRIETCERFDGPPDCEEECSGQLDI